MVKEIIFIYTYKCNFSCEHCASESSILRKEKLSTDMIEKTFSQMRNNNILRFTITGGEPFLFADDVIFLLKVSRKYKLVSSIQTNCSWIKNSKKSEYILKNLKKYASNTTIVCGYDYYHSSFISVQDILLSAEKLRFYNIDFLVVVTIEDKVDIHNYVIINTLIKNNIKFKINKCGYFGRYKYKNKDISKKKSFSGSYLSDNNIFSKCYFIDTIVVTPTCDSYFCCNSIFFDIPIKEYYYLGNLKKDGLEYLLHNKEQKRRLLQQQSFKISNFNIREFINNDRCNSCIGVFMKI